jgi:gliding motility-associated-like protein
MMSDRFYIKKSAFLIVFLLFLVGWVPVFSQTHNYINVREVYIVNTNKYIFNTNTSRDPGEWKTVQGSATLSNPNSHSYCEFSNVPVGINIFEYYDYNGWSATYPEHSLTIWRINAGADAFLCYPTSTYTLNANNPSDFNSVVTGGSRTEVGTGAWTRIAGSGTVTSPSSYNSTITGLGAGVNKFVWTVSCNYYERNAWGSWANNVVSGTDTITITVVQLPANLAGPDKSVCSGSPVSLSAVADPDYQYSWSTGATTQSISVSPLVNTTYSLTVTDVNNCQATDNVTVNVNSLPNVSLSLSSPSPYCVNAAPVTLTRSPLGGTITSSAPAAISGVTFSPSTAGVGTHSITYTYTDGNSCTNSASKSVVVNALPVVNITGLNAVYCSNDPSVLLTGSPLSNGSGVFGTFTGTGITNNGDGTASFNPSAAPATGDYSITYQVSNADGCVNSAIKSTHVNKAPSLSIAGLPATICQNTSITISGNMAPGGTLSGSGITDLGNGTATFNTASLAPGNYSVSYSYQDPVTLCSSVVTKAVTVNPAPVKFPVTGGGEYCANAPVPQAIGVSNTENGVQYELFRNGSTTSLTINGNGNPMSFPSQLLAGNYTVKGTNGFSCTSTMTSSADVSIIASPTVFTLSASPTSYCAGTNGVTLTLSLSQLGIKYTLYKDNAPVGTVMGTGNKIEWFNVTKGVYKVEAEASGSVTCTILMNGNITVTELALPNANAGLDVPICKGQSVQLNASGGTTYSWSNAATLNNASIANPVATPASTTVYTVTVTDAYGCVKTDQVQVLVRALPTAVASTPATICNGDKAILTATDNVIGNNESYLWNNGATNDTIIVNPSTNTTYTVTITDVFGCSNTASTTVTVNPRPGVNAGSDTEVCFGSSLTLNGSGNANTWLWNTGATTLSVNVTPSATSDYILRGTFTATGCTTTDTVHVTVNPLPVVSFKRNGSTTKTQFCSNGGLVVLEGNPAGGSFSCSTAGTISGNSFDPAVAGIGNHTIIYSYTNSKGCIGTSSVIVNVVGPPVVSITGLGASYCSTDAPFTVTGNPVDDGNGVKGTWAFSGPGAAKTDNPDGTCTIDLSTITVAGNYTLTYTVGNSSGCMESASKTFAVKAGPSVSFVGLPTSICQNANPITLTGNQGTNGVFTGSGITDNGNGTALFTPSSLIPGPYSIKFAYTDATTTCSSDYTRSVTVNPVPQVFSVTGGGSFCAGSTGKAIGLSGSANGINYELIRDGVSTGNVKGGTGAAITFGDQTVPGSYTVIARDATTLCEMPMNGSASITVDPLPLDAQVISGLTSVCPGSTGIYSIPVITNATTYVWQLPAGATITSGPGTATINVSFGSSAASGDIEVYGQNTCGQGASSLLPITVKSLPAAAGVISGTTTVCQNTMNVVYSVPAIAGATNYLWTVPSGASIVSGLGTGTIVVNYGSAALSGNITVRGENSCGNGGLRTLPVTVNPTPQLTVNAPSGDITCSANSVTVSATSSTPGATYLWTAINGGSITGINTNASTTVNAAGKYIIAVTSNACTSRDTVTVISDMKAPADVNISVTNGGEVTCLVPAVTLSATTTSTFGVSYQWTPSAGGHIVSGAGLANAVVDKGGVYEVKVTNLSTGCYTSKSVTINEVKNAPDVTVTNPEDEKISCSKKEVTLTGSSTVSGVSYSWSGPGIVSGGNTGTPLVNAIGTYTLTVTAPNGCPAVATVQVLADNTVPTISVNSNPADLTCTVTSVTLEGKSTTAGAILLWTGPGITSANNIETPVVNKPGVYTLTVTHPTTGCSVSGAVTVDENITKPVVTFPVIPSEITCDNSGLTTIKSAVTATNKTYQWSTSNGTIVSGATSQDVVVSKAGTYTLVVTDTDNGCTGTASINAIENNTLPDAQIAAPATVTCSAGSIQLTGSSATTPINILWSTTDGNIVSGDNTFNPTINKGGTYTMTITNTNTKCVSTASVLVSENKTKPIISIDKNPAVISCAAPTIKLNGTAAGSTLVWTGPAGAKITNPTSPTPTVDMKGRYYLVATNALGCTSKDSTDVTDNLVKPINLTIGAPGTLTCTNNTLNLTGNTQTPSATYKWTGLNGGHILSADNGSTITIDKPGDYKMVVTHPSSFCKDSVTTTVAQNISAPTISFPIVPAAITCTKITSSLDANLSPANALLLWTGPGAISDATIKNPNVSAAGTYTLKATHPVTGCVTTATLVVPEDKTLPDITIATPAAVTCTAPDVLLDATTSLTNFTAQWSTTNGSIVGASNTLDIVAGKEGLYTLLLTNKDNGCTNTQNVLVNANNTLPDIQVDPNPAKITCSVNKVKLYGTSATAGTSLLWSGPGGITNPASETPEVDAIGVYTLTVTNSVTGCKSTATVTVAEDKTVPVVPTILVPDKITCTKNTVNLELSPVPTNVDILWTVTSGTGTITNEKTSVATVDAIGTYTVTITDRTSGCPRQNSVTVSENKAVSSATITGGPYEISCTNAKLTLTGTTDTGINPVWSASSGGHILSGANTLTPEIDAAGTYTLTVTNAVTGCTNSASIVVTKAAGLPTLAINPFPNELTCAKDTVGLSGRPTQTGTTFTWTASPGHFVSGETTFNPIVDQPGSYILTVTNTSNGCKSVAAINVVQNIAAPDAVIAVPDQFTCTTTQVQLTGSSTNPNVSKQWTTSGTGNIRAGDETAWNPIVYAPATYTLTVTDVNNQCKTAKNIVVTENKTLPDITVDKTPLPLTCTRKQVTLSGSSLTTGATYLWTTSGSGNILNPTSKSPSVDAPGTYTLQVTDPVNGCKKTDNVSVTTDIAAPQIWVNTTPSILNCAKDTVYLKGSSTTANVTYLWTGPGKISNAAVKDPYVDAPGVYTLTVTSVANGCTASLPVTVTRNKTVPAAPLLTGNASCYGSPATALTAVGNNIKWYSNPALGNAYKIQTGNSYTPATVNLPGDYSFYATQTDPITQCESNASQVTYTVRSLPASPVNINRTICEGDPNKTLTASGNNIKWYNTPGGAVISTGTYAPAVTAPGTYTYYTTQTDANNCQSPASAISLTIQPIPRKPTVNQLTAATCFGSANPVFTASGTNLQWYTSPTLPAPVKTGASFTPLETTTGTYSYYVTQTSAYGCVSPYETVTLDIRPIPQAFTVTGGGEYCENAAGLNVGLGGSQLNTSYQLILNGTTVITSMAGTGAALDFGLQKAAGNYTVRAINNNTCEAMMSGGVAITSNPLPGNAATVTGSASVCEGAVNVAYSIPAIANAASYTWSIPSGAVVTSGLNTRTITVDYLPGSKTGQVTVLATNVCGTGAISPNLQVIVTPLPLAAGNIKFIGTNNHICLGDSGVIYEVDAIDNATSYEWELPTGATVYSGANSRQIRVRFAKNAPTGSHTVRVRGVNSCGAGTYSAAYNITVNSNPTVYAGIDQNLCSDQTSLQGNVVPAGGTGIWSQILGNSAIINNADAGLQIKDIAQGLNMYTWKITYNGCSATDTVKVINNKLDVEAGESLPLCSQSINLRGTPPPVGTSGIWTVGSGSASFVKASQYNTSASDFGYGDNKLYWTITKNGCQSRDSITIINYRPVTPDAGADQTICIGETRMAAVVPVYGKGQWSVFSGQASFTDVNDPKTLVTGIGKGESKLVWTVINMICSLSDTVVITNNELDVDAGYDQVVCENRSTIEGTAPPTGSSGQWSVYIGSASFLDGRSNNTKVSGLVNGVNKLVWSITRGSCVNTDTVSIVCNMPSVANAGPDQFLANGNTIMDANDPAVGVGKWSVISGAANFVNENLHNTSVTGLNPGANILRWTITYNGCSTFDEVTITNGTIEKVDAGQDQTICTNQTVLEAARPQYGFGIWTVQKGSANFEDNEAYNSKVTNLSPGTNILRWSVVVSGIEFYDTVTIVNNQPTTAITGPKQILCIDSSALTANVPVQGSGKWTLEGGAATIANIYQSSSKVTGLGSGDNIFRWTITKGTCTSSALLVITNDKTTKAEAGIDQTVCDDKTTLLPAPAYVGTGEWIVVSGSGKFSNNEVTGLASGQNVLRWKITKNNCSSYDDMIVISHKATKASAGLNTVVCVDSLFLAANKANASIGEFGRWTIMNGSGQISDTTLNTSLVKRLAQGVNVLRWTINNNGCLSYSDVQVNYAQVKSDAGPSILTCDNHVILNANNPTLGVGEWSVVGGSGSAVFTDPNSPNTEVKNLDQGANILKWTINNFSCYSSSEVVITNNAPSVAFAGGDQSLCVNSSTLAARQPFIGKGSWSVLSGAGLFSDTSAYNSKIYNIGSGSNTYRWTVRNQNCVSADEVVVNNNKPIGTYAGLDQTLCSDSAILSANQPIVGAGVWGIMKGAGQLQDAFNAATSIRKLAPDTNVLRWTVTNKQCVEFQEIKIVNNVPTMPSAGADRILCSAQTNMDGNALLYGQGEWLVISGSGTFTNKNLYNSEVKGLTLGKNIFQWKASKQGCILTDDVVLTNDLPTKPDAGTDISVCDNNAPLNANKPVIGTGYWSIISGKGTFIDSTQYNTRIVGLGQGSNLLTWTTVHNRCKLSDVIDVRNNQTNVYAGPDQMVFENSSILVGNEPQRGVGTWSLSGGGGVISTPSNFESVVTGLEEGINTFLWSVNISGCISSDAVAITYYRIPTASFSINDGDGCPPLEVRFTKTTIEKYPYKWYFGDKDSTSTEENPTFVYETPGKYSAKLVVTGPDGNPVEMVKTITVHNLPKASFELVPSTIYIPEEELRCFNYSTGSNKYLWDFGDGGTSDVLNPAYAYKDSGVYTVKLTVWSEHGCVDSLTIPNGVHVIESTSIKFPSAFTPNMNGPSGGTYNRNDYSNDVFYPILITGEIENYHMEIYNRWGVLIFESKDFNIGWDGYYKGKLMSEDVFIYRVSGNLNNGKKVNLTGDFLLMHRD